LAWELAASDGLTTVRDLRRRVPGRAYATYHFMLSFYGEYALRRLVSECHSALALPGLVRVPTDRVYLPLLRIGAAEDLTPAELTRVEWNARNLCVEEDQFRVAIGPPCVAPGGVRLCVTPWSDLAELRHGLRRCARDVLGLRPWLRELIPFRPRVPIAYAERTMDASEVRARLARLRPLHPVLLRIRRVSLVRLTIGDDDASWFTTADMALGPRTGF